MNPAALPVIAVALGGSVALVAWVASWFRPRRRVDAEPRGREVARRTVERACREDGPASPCPALVVVTDEEVFVEFHARASRGGGTDLEQPLIPVARLALGEIEAVEVVDRDLRLLRRGSWWRFEGAAELRPAVRAARGDGTP